MNILYEEDGSFKVGSVMTDSTTSLQVESLSGKRSKIKAANVMLRFTQPALGEFLPQAEPLVADIDVEFLWECCPPDEFGFEQIAADYFGHTPSALEAAAVLLRLHGAPIYFHKKGKGRYRAAPPEVLKAALAGAEKKRQQLALQAHYTEQLIGFELPDAFKAQLTHLLYQPDRNTLEVKALEAACAATHLSSAHLLHRCGALPSTEDFHLGKFLFEQFPKGLDFPPVTLSAWEELPLATATAFSIDDASTTEIDDAFSWEKLENGHYRIGVHIAAPALGLTRDSDGDKLAATRLSTVYMPGRKITMLPDSVVQAFTLEADRVCPALSMYLEVDAETLLITAHSSRVERIHIAANLRHDSLEPLFNEETLAAGKLDYEYATELTWLWAFAQKLEALRGKAGENQNQLDYNFHIEHDFVSISTRRRGSPIDKVVAELMILVNSTWGKQLDEHGFPGIYRTQNNGKVKMSTIAAPHQGLGVAQYMWSSSPLRRYVDLVNQRQIIAMLNDAEPIYPKNDTGLYAVLRDFEVTYGVYNDFQRNMERYWCLRWLQQEKDALSPTLSHEVGEGVNELMITATVIRENLVRVSNIPLVFRAHGLPEQPAGTRVRLAVGEIDLIDVDMKTRFVEAIVDAVVEPIQEEDLIASENSADAEVTTEEVAC
ncbi:MAG: RNB domain-containing ribonuclease [Gallionella sp.]|nr:RNB domain-containing ribonuclease [Gallionella sp.]MDD4957715.1 RNB domain-containing ribonuclease [Gallionella sp.]